MLPVFSDFHPIQSPNGLKRMSSNSNTRSGKFKMTNKKNTNDKIRIFHLPLTILIKKGMSLRTNL